MTPRTSASLPGGLGLVAGDESAEEEVADRGAEDEQQPPRFPSVFRGGVPVAVVDEAHHHQPAEATAQFAGPDEVESQQRKRQEDQEECVGVENHPDRRDPQGLGGGSPAGNADSGGGWRRR